MYWKYLRYVIYELYSKIRNFQFTFFQFPIYKINMAFQQKRAENTNFHHIFDSFCLKITVYYRSRLSRLSRLNPPLPPPPPKSLWGRSSLGRATETTKFRPPLEVPFNAAIAS